MHDWSADDHRYMARAIELAWLGELSCQPNPRVGCVIVRDGQIVGEGFHERAGEGHAEVNALAQAGELAKGATAYVTLEPCSHYGRTPPCARAIVDAGLARVISAMQDPNPLVAGKGVSILSDAGIQVELGLLEEQSKQLNIGFISRMTRKRPFVRLKMAASVDGRTAMASGESQWITGAAAREDVQAWRAKSSAILTGVGTVLHDNAKLTVRTDHLLDKRGFQPMRVVLDAHARLTGQEAVFENNAAVQYVVSEEAKASPEIVGSQHVNVVRLALDAKGYFDLSALLHALAEQEVNDLFVEAGESLAGSFIDQNCVDELLLYVAPKLMGHQAKALANLPFDRMGQAIDLDLKDVRKVGVDLRFQYQFKGAL